MSNRPFLIFGAFVALVGVIAYLAFTKEGSEGATTVPIDAADEESREIFADKCGACHTLAAGGTDGVVGPNLDEILVPEEPAEGLSPEEVIEANTQSFESSYLRTISAVTCGRQGRMPAGILQGASAEEVSGFVAAYAGRLAEDQGPLLPADERELAPEPDDCASVTEEEPPASG